MVRFTRGAREDLPDIWLYIAPRNSEAVANRIYDRIEEACRAALPVTRNTALPARRSPKTHECSSAVYHLVDDGAQVRWCGSLMVPATSQKLIGRRNS